MIYSFENFIHQNYKKIDSFLYRSQDQIIDIEKGQVVTCPLVQYSIQSKTEFQVLANK